MSFLFGWFSPEIFKERINTADIKKNAEENLKKTENLSSKAEELNNSAKNFYELTKQLNKKYNNGAVGSVVNSRVISRRT